MMRTPFASLILALGAMLGAGTAMAHGPAWSVSIGPGGYAGVSVGFAAPVHPPAVIPYGQIAYPAPVYVAPRVVYSPPVYAMAPRPMAVHAPPVRVVVPPPYGYAHGHAGGYGHRHGHGHGGWRHY